MTDSRVIVEPRVLTADEVLRRQLERDCEPIAAGLRKWGTANDGEMELLMAGCITAQDATKCSERIERWHHLRSESWLAADAAQTCGNCSCPEFQSHYGKVLRLAPEFYDGLKR